MHTITVIGLGPGSKEYVTLGAIEAMKNSSKLYLRTQKHPVVSYLETQNIYYESFDAIYDTKDSFDEVYNEIVDLLIQKVYEQDITYAVPGSPFVAENTVQILMERSKQEDFKLEFVPSVSFVEAIFHTLKKDPIKGLSIIDGLRLDEQIPNTDTDVIITQVYDRFVASEIKLKLMEYYDDEYPVTVIRAAGIPGEEKIKNVKLYELDRVEWLDYLTSVYIKKRPQSFVQSTYTLKDLMGIMKRLRQKNGCPWDIKQTHESLKPHLIEEAYEVLEAIDQKDSILLEEELGDLLLQVVFHVQIASEKDVFTIKDVLTSLCKKLIFRHPHVFGEMKVDSDEGAIKSWEKMKLKEKNVDSYTQELKRIPKHLPALMKSFKVQKKAAGVGFDWDHVEDALEKVKEELEEVLEVYNTDEMTKIKEELGDLLFAVVNVTRFLKVDPEIALNEATQKFIDRFEFIEESGIKKGKTLEEMSLKEMDELWELAKIHKNKKKDKKY